MQDSTFHQANNIVTQVLEEIREVQNMVLVVQALDTNCPNVEQQEWANAVNDTSTAVNLELMKMLKSLQDEIKDLKLRDPPLMKARKMEKIGVAWRTSIVGLMVHVATQDKNATSTERDIYLMLPLLTRKVVAPTSARRQHDGVGRCKVRLVIS